MKKLLALLLSVMMAMSLAVPALAMEEAVPISAPAGGNAWDDIVDGDFDWWTADDEQALIDAMKEALGGVPGQIGVMVNGEYVQFPDAVPEIANNRTMVPVRALVETLGGEIDYEAGMVQFILDGFVYTFAIGSETVTVRPAGDGGAAKPDIKMDCAPYIRNNRTYVPIRFISEALGYDVGWDADFRTAILLDREAMAAEIDKDFTILNRVQASQGITLKEGESARADLNGKLDLTLASLEGNQTYSADFSITGLMNSEAINGSASLSLSEALVELLMTEGGLDEEDGMMVQAILAALEKFEFIMNKDGMMWVHADGLDELIQKKDVWFAAAAEISPDLDLSALLAGQEAPSVGKVVAAMADVNSVMGYASVNVMVQMMYGLYGDDRFTTENGVSALTIGIDELMAVYQAMGIDEAGLEEIAGAFQSFELTMKVDDKGGVTVACAMETAAADGVPAMKVTMDAEQSAGKADLTMTLHVANVCQVELTLTSSESAAADQPVTQPPEGAVIIDTGTPLEP